MHRARPSLPIALALAAVGALALGAVARAQAPVIYKWVDENGVAHYTTDRERIPSAIRDRLIQGGEAARGTDWLRRDAGPPGASPAPITPSLPSATAPAASRDREAEDVELPEDSDGVHAVEAQPDWSQAPGGEATWAPGDLGDAGRAAPGPQDHEDGQAPAPATAKPAPPVEPPPVQAPPAADETATAARAPAPPPPPPPAPLEADGAPIPTPAPAADEPPAAVAASPALEEPAPLAEPAATEVEPAVVEQAPEAAPAEPAVEPSAPAAVASPAPRDLAPDEQAELAALDAQITEVEAKIARDEEALMVLISENEATEHDALVDDPQFRDIAQRLPKLQADLERLRERRAQIQPAVSRP